MWGLFSECHRQQCLPTILSRRYFDHEADTNLQTTIIKSIYSRPYSLESITVSRRNWQNQSTAQLDCWCFRARDSKLSQIKTRLKLGSDCRSFKSGYITHTRGETSQKIFSLISRFDRSQVISRGDHLSYIREDVRVLTCQTRKNLFTHLSRT